TLITVPHVTHLVLASSLTSGSQQSFSSFCFFSATSTPDIYTLSLHDALPICSEGGRCTARQPGTERHGGRGGVSRADVRDGDRGDRKSTRLNSSHVAISYAVFCLKKKKK